MMRHGLKHGATSERPHCPPVCAQGTMGTCRLRGSQCLTQQQGQLSFDEGGFAESQLSTAGFSCWEPFSFPPATFPLASLHRWVHGGCHPNHSLI